MDEAAISTFDAIKANLFPRSHAAISNWEKFPWHRDRSGVIQTNKIESSQALAIDVFGTIQVSDEKDRILAALARRCGVPDEGPWIVKLEWVDPANFLGEPTPTHVDAVAFGKSAILLTECKFTEAGGACSQPNPILKGPHRGLRQCNGDYALQTNPINGKTGRCALTGKGVRYWEMIPEIFGLAPETDYSPCPFRGENYQWMRNVLLAHRLATARKVSGAVLAVFADGESFVTSRKAHSGALGFQAASGKKFIFPISYQSIISLARLTSDHPKEWVDLEKWIERKITTVEARKNATN